MFKTWIVSPEKGLGTRALSIVINIPSLNSNQNNKQINKSVSNNNHCLVVTKWQNSVR